MARRKAVGIGAPPPESRVRTNCSMDSLWPHGRLSSCPYNQKSRFQTPPKRSGNQQWTKEISRYLKDQGVSGLKNLQESPVISDKTQTKQNLKTPLFDVEIKPVKEGTIIYWMSDFIHFFCNMYFDIMLSFILRPRGTDDYELVTIKSEIVCELLSM